MPRPLRHALALLAVAAAAVGTAPAEAQVGPAGQWVCEFGARNTAPGVPPNAVLMRFQMVVDPRGLATGQGTQSGATGAYPFTFQGQWSVNGREFVVRGQSSGGLSFGVQGFAFASDFVGPGAMARNTQFPNGQVSATQCQRVG